MIALSIMFYILEFLMFAFILYRIFDYRKMNLKDTLIYPILIIFSFVFIFIINVNIGTFTINSFHEFCYYMTVVLQSCVGLVRLSIDKGLFSALETNLALLYNYIILYALYVLTLFNLFIPMIRIVVCNFCRIKIFKKEINIIIGYNSDAKEFIKNLSKKQRKDTIVVFKKTLKKEHHDQTFYLNYKKIKYKILNLSNEKDFIKAMNRLTYNYKFIRELVGSKKYNFITFLETGKENYNFINWSTAYLENNPSINKTSKKMQFIISSDFNNRQFLDEQIKEVVQGHSKGYIRTFDKYRITAYNFIREYDFAKYFPKSLLHENGTIEPDCDINLFLFGFGKVNQALLNDILVNTQFIEEKDNHLSPKKMEVYIFDENKKYNNITLSSEILHYKRECFNEEEYLPLPDDFTSHIHFNFDTNIGQNQFINQIQMNLQKKESKQINYFIISLETDSENNLLAKELFYHFSGEENYYNTYFVRTKEGMQMQNPEFIYFNNTNNVLNYDSVVADKIYLEAKKEHCRYMQCMDKTIYDIDDREAINTYWSTLSYIDQLSNLYAIASLNFKLSLLQVDNLNTLENQQEFIRKYYDKTKDKYLEQEQIFQYEYSEKLTEDSSKLSTRDILAYLEHNRWNAFQLSCGVLPLKIEEAKKLKRTKTPDGKKHLCITTNEGLNTYYHLIPQINESLTQDVIQYDYNYMDGVFNEIYRRENK